MAGNNRTLTPIFLSYNKAEVQRILSSVSRIDSDPTEDSPYPISSGGVHAALDQLKNGDRTKVIAQESAGTSLSPISIKPNCLNRWATPVGALYVSLAQGTSGVVSEYMLEFTVAGGNFTLQLPASVRWMDGDAPDWESGYTYQVSILNNMAIAAGWPNS